MIHQCSSNIGVGILSGMHCSWLIFHGLVGVWIIGGVGGYVSLVLFVVRFINVLSGVGGAIWQNISGIRNVLAVSFICWV